ncbi:hypothetical protein UFOVP230_34 [uncultured Caudovirales phage]|uniref:Uncharacterized protein n=1 Tax=uncultured Caudovirales phage TaxID=2100421 RepID=A0A6J7XRF1_9CAUD|nr:hypothetical protein UFOVP230_34 [uncultured Caudovirales phage]
MNANELADAMDTHGFRYHHVKKAVALLRQQQNEIEALKKDNKELHAIAQRMAMAESDARKSLQWFKDAKEMKNEPIAWMWQDDDEEWVEVMPRKGIPFYTHPVKELTDEEIRHIQAQCHLKDVGYDGFIMRFARAILRKAQEK